MIQLTKGKLNILIDGQFGSTGKGLFAEYIARNDANIDIAMTNAGPNAGHTFTVAGNKVVTKQLPVTGILNDGYIYLTQGSVINIDLLFKEIKDFDIKERRLYIHPQATIVTEEDISLERSPDSSFNDISSTQSGVGSAIANKIKRSAKVAKDIEILKAFVKPFQLESFLDKGYKAVMEVPQGLGLSLNSDFYPYCTSRDITIANTLNDAGVHPYYLGKVLACIRTYPIRVGNLPNSYSGDFYPDSVETTWEKLGVDKEYTTNTKRIRRVATFSYKQYDEMLLKFRPDYVFLNFCNYLSAKELYEMLPNLPEVTHLGFGSDVKDIKEVRVL